MVVKYNITDEIKIQIKNKLESVFNYLKIGFSEELFNNIFNCYLGKKGEAELIYQLSKILFYSKVNEKRLDLTKRKFDTISSYICGDYILDLGAGDGKLSELISDKLEKNIILIDVTDFNQTKIPMILYDGKNLPFSKNYFDTVLLIVVLHHCEDLLQVLKEAIRVSRKRIIIIEAVYTSFEEKELNKFFDWFSNRILLKRKIDVPFNYKKHEEWIDIFKQLNLSVLVDIDLGWIHQPLAPEHRRLYILDKTNGSFKDESL